MLLSPRAVRLRSPPPAVAPLLTPGSGTVPGARWPRTQAPSLGPIPLLGHTFAEPSAAPAPASLLLLHPMALGRAQPGLGSHPSHPPPREPSARRAGHQGRGFGAEGGGQCLAAAPSSHTRCRLIHHTSPVSPTASLPAQPHRAHTPRSRYPAVPTAIPPEPDGLCATPSASPAVPTADAPVSVPHQHRPSR